MRIPEKYTGNSLGFDSEILFQNFSKSDQSQIVTLHVGKTRNIGKWKQSDSKINRPVRRQYPENLEQVKENNYSPKNFYPQTQHFIIISYHLGYFVKGHWQNVIWRDKRNGTS